MKNLLILFVFFYASTSISQELMNFYLEPNGTDEITLHTMVYKNTNAFLGGYDVNFEDNIINVSLCYQLTSAQSITLDSQVNIISLPIGYSTYTLNLELFGDGDGAPCTLDNLADTGTLTFEYPYDPTATTYVPDNVFEDYLEDLGFGDDIVYNDFVYTHRINNKKHLFLGPGVFNLSGDVSNMEGLQDFLALKELRCQDNQISILDVSNNQNLEWLWCDSNPIEQLNVTNNIDLKMLWANGNDLTSIDVTNNVVLKELKIVGNEITTLDVTNNGVLEKLEVGGNPIETLDLSNNILLESLSCGNTLITSLEVSNNINLKILNLNVGTLSTINLNNNVLLEELYFEYNQFTELDLSNLSNLKLFDAWENQLTSLDFSNNTQIETIYLFGNNLTSLNLKNGNNSNIGILYARDNDDLYCIDVDDPSQAPYDGWNVEDQVVFSDDCSLGLDEVLATQITIYPNPVKDVLTINNDSDFTINNLKIYNVLGELVLKQNKPTHQLDVTKLESGLYFVSLNIDKGNLIKKMIKK